jgi:hypothetical protein
MALDLGSLVGFLEIDSTRWDKGIDDALRGVDEFGTKAKPRAEAAGKKAGTAAGDGFAKGAEQEIDGAGSQFRTAGEKARPARRSGTGSQTGPRPVQSRPRPRSGSRSTRPSMSTPAATSSPRSWTPTTSRPSGTAKPPPTSTPVPGVSPSMR